MADQRDRRARCGAPRSSGAASRQVHQRQRRGDHDRRQRRLRQVGEQRVQEQQQHRDEPGADEPGDLGLGPRLLGHGGARAAGRDGEALEQARRRCWRRPIPIISWSGSTSSPRRAAKLVAVAIVSVSDTSVMPTAAISSGPTSPAFVHGKARRRHPLRERADGRRRRGRQSPSTAETTVAPTTATSTAGSRCVTRGSTSSTREHRQPDGERGRVRLVEAVEERPHLVEERVGVGREAEQLRQLADDDRDRRARSCSRPAPPWRAGRRRTRACPGRGRSRSSPTSIASMPASAIAVAGSPPDEQRGDRGEDQRRDRRVGAEHEHPRGTEERRSRPGRRSSCRGRSPPAGRRARA